MLTDIQGNPSGALHFDRGNGKLYTDSGRVLDPVTGHMEGSFAVSGPMVPDSTLGYAYFLDQTKFTVKCYDLNRFTLAATLNIQNTPLASDTIPGYQIPNRIIRWGDSGLALGGGGCPVYLISGPFVLGQ